MTSFASPFAMSKPNRNMVEDDDRRLSDVLPSGLTLDQIFLGHDSAIGRIAWSPDGHVLASPDENGTLRTWDIHSKRILNLNNAGYNSSLLAASFSNDGSLLGLISEKKSIYILNRTNWTSILDIKLDEIPFSLDFNPKSGKLAIGCANEIVIYSIESNNIFKTISLNKNNHICHSISHDDSGLLIAAGIDSNVHIYSSTTARLLSKLRTEKSGTCYSLQFSPDSTLLAVGCGKVVEIYDPVNGRLLRVLEGHTDIVDSVSFSKTLPLLASKSNDSTVRIWRRDTWNLVAELRAPKGNHSQWPSLAFHPTLPLIAIVTSDAERSKDKRRDNLVYIYKIDERLVFPDL